MGRLLFPVFSNVHGPLSVRSRRDHLHWVSTSIGLFDWQEIVCLRRFRTYKAWAKNLTGHRIGILRGDKGEEYLGADPTVSSWSVAYRGSTLFVILPDSLESLSVLITQSRNATLLSQLGLARIW